MTRYFIYCLHLLIMQLQSRQKEQGDDEAQGVDEVFVDAYVLLLAHSLLFLTISNTGLSMVCHQPQVGAWVSTGSLCSLLTPLVRVVWSNITQLTVVCRH
jgi:hypothetical protein